MSGPDRFDDRAGFQAALRAGLLAAREHGLAMTWIDEDFADWPLGEPAWIDGLTGWRANYPVRVAGCLLGVADIAFPAARLIVEVDGLAHHSTPDRFQRDRTRQNALVAAGWTVLRFTWQDLVERPEAVVGTIRRQLAGVA